MLSRSLWKQVAEFEPDGCDNIGRTAPRKTPQKDSAIFRFADGEAR